MNRDSMARLARTAWAIKAAILLILALLALGAAYVLFVLVGDGTALTALVQDQITGPGVPTTLHAPAIFGLAVLAAVNLAVILYGLACVWRFASLISRGRVFSVESGRWLRQAGAMALVGAAGMVISRLLAILLATMGNPPGQAHLVIAFGTDEAFLLLFAALLFALGHAIVLAAEIEAENRTFI